MEITFVHDVLLLCLLSWYEETVPSVRIYSIGQKLRHCRFWIHLVRIQGIRALLNSIWNGWDLRNWIYPLLICTYQQGLVNRYFLNIRIGWISQMPQYMMSWAVLIQIRHRNFPFVYHHLLRCSGQIEYSLYIQR